MNSSSSSPSLSKKVPRDNEIPDNHQKNGPTQKDQVSFRAESIFEGTGTPISAISTASSATEYFDILPSFQMYQSILKRDNSQFSESLYSVSPPTYESQRQTYANQTLNANQEANSTGHTVLDNIDNLTKSGASPIEVQIFVTKQVPVPHQSNALETRLKEYHQGDLINGYIIINNVSSKPLNFGLFTVSLEGTVKNLRTKEHPNRTLSKKFLRMYDLNASYGYCCVPNSAGIQYEPFTKDEFDGTELGLPNERLLQPNTKYKKFFTFRLPHKLLDSSCAHEIGDHYSPPPSFGLDKSSFGGKAKVIQYNKALGYGFLESRGTPLLTLDHCVDNISISYSIEARFIDQVRNNIDGNIYVISKEASYYLRFIPKSVNDPLAGNYSCLDQHDIDPTFIQLQDFDNRVRADIENKISPDKTNYCDRKNKQISSIKKPLTTSFDFTSDYESVFSKSVYSRKSKLLASYQKIGVLKLSCKPLIGSLPSTSPKLLANYNSVVESSPLMNSRPTSPAQNKLQNLKLDLQYFPNNSNSVVSPSIESFDVKLISHTYHTDLSIPVKLHSDFFQKYDTPEKLGLLQNHFKNYSEFLMANDIEIDSQLARGVKSLEMLHLKTDTFNIFETISFGPNSTSVPWAISQDPETGKLSWNAKVNVPLIYNDSVLKNAVVPSFQSCIIGRCYILEICVRLRGGSSNRGGCDNAVKCLVPVTVC